MVIADAGRFNMDAVSIANLRAALEIPEAEAVVDVWPENWDIVCAFVAVATQWRTAAIGGGFSAPALIHIGLDYASVRVALDAEGIAVTAGLWRGLRVMEAAAKAALNEVNR